MDGVQHILENHSIVLRIRAGTRRSRTMPLLAQTCPVDNLHGLSTIGISAWKTGNASIRAQCDRRLTGLARMHDACAFQAERFLLDKVHMISQMRWTIPCPPSTESISKGLGRRQNIRPCMHRTHAGSCCRRQTPAHSRCILSTCCTAEICRDHMRRMHCCHDWAAQIRADILCTKFYV